MATINAVGNGLRDVTGAGKFVGDTSPTLVTPLLGTPTSGTLTNCTGLPTAGILCSSTNDSAAAGKLGETADSGLVSGTFTVSATVYNATSISLTAGTWRVNANLVAIPSTYNTSYFEGGINTTSATIPTTGYTTYFVQTLQGGGGATGISTTAGPATTILKLSGTTTVYICAKAVWSGGSAPTYSCQLTASRIR